MVSWVISLVLLGILSGCSGTHFMGFPEQAWHALSKEEQADLLAQKRHHEGIRRFDHLPEGPFSEVRIALSDGSALLWPGSVRMSFEPVQATLALGQCRDLVLQNGSHATVLSACYQGGTLTLDPNRHNEVYAHGGLVLHQNALWRFGVVNPSVHSYGHVGLHQVRLTIQGAYDG